MVNAECHLNHYTFHPEHFALFAAPCPPKKEVINKKTNFQKSLDRNNKGCIIVNVDDQERLNTTKKEEYAGIVQLVEHLLAKEKVASSSLAARSFFYRTLCSAMATWPSGKARVCKTLIIGSNPIVASMIHRLVDFLL